MREPYRDGWISKLYVWLVFVPLYTLAFAAFVFFAGSAVLRLFGVR